MHTHIRERARIVYIRVDAVCGRQHPSAVDQAAATDVLILVCDVIVQLDGDEPWPHGRLGGLSPHNPLVSSVPDLLP